MQDQVNAAASAVYVRCPEAVSCPIGDGAAILDMRSATYFSLNAVGAHVWDALEEPVGADAIVARIVARCDTGAVPAARIERDVAAMLAELLRAELISAARD